MPTATIKDKLALVTGGSRGIGLAISRALLERGARVWICALRPASLEKALTALGKEHGPRVGGETCDVRAAGQVRAAFVRLRRDWKGLDILVNNAGIGIFKSVADMTPAEWEASIETNLSGVFHCCREALPLMKARGGGYIVNIGSLAGKNPFAGGAAYNASKFGLIGFSEAQMQEVVSVFSRGRQHTRMRVVTRQPLRFQMMSC